MIELSLYIVVACLSATYSFATRVRRDYFFVFLWFFIYVSLVIAVRLDFQGDIEVYARSFSFNSFSLYYLREPVVWLGGRLLFQILGDEQLVFITLDLIVGIVLWKALVRFGAPRYLFFAILCFFPFILGMQNVYRQHMSTVFLLAAFSFGRSSPIRYPLISFVFAVASHNAAAVFLPVLVLKRRSFRSLLFTLSLFISFFGIVVGASSKSFTSIGKDLGLAYLLFFVLLFIFYFAAGRLKISKVNREDFGVLFVYLFVVLIGYLFLGGSGRERLGMMAMILMLVPLSAYLDKKIIQSSIVGFLIAVLGFIPLFLFGTRVFLLS